MNKLSIFLHFKNSILTFNFALGDLISPGADTGFAVVSESRSALVTTSLTVPAGPEDVTFVLIREDTVKTRAVRSADGSLCFIFKINLANSKQF